jgi:alkanesulfonate monooxygenase
MSVHFYWFAPTNGDGEYLGLEKPERKPTLDYLVNVAKTAEKAGFEGILIPVGTPYLDSWLVGSAIIHHTQKIKTLIALRPGFVAPTVAAKMASTLDQFSEGRVLVNIVIGGSAKELGQDGDFLAHDDRYRRTDEFLDVLQKSWTGSEVNYSGDYFTINQGLLPSNIHQNQSVPIYFGGSSEVAKEIAAKSADVYLQWGEPVEQIKQQIEDIKQRAQKYGRALEFGVRIHVVVRDDEKEAWEAAEKIISRVDRGVQGNMDHYYETTDSVAQKRMNELTKQTERFGKYGWSGIGKVRKGAGTALVGTPTQVREGLQEYIDAGVTHFVLSGFPHLEESQRFGSSVLPLFKEEVLPIK